MEHPDPPDTDPGAARSWPTGEEALRQLEGRLERASQAAERLLAEAALRARTGNPEPDPPAAGQPPPSGWQAPESGDRAGGTGGELELLLGLIASVRGLIPPDLERRLGEALRELLLAVRALIDWYLERMERRPTEPSEIQDIPIS